MTRPTKSSCTRATGGGLVRLKTSHVWVVDIDQQKDCASAHSDDKEDRDSCEGTAGAASEDLVEIVCLLPPAQSARDFGTKSSLRAKSGTSIDAAATNEITQRVVRLHAQSERTLALTHSLSNACFMYANNAFGIPGHPGTHTNYTNFVKDILDKFSTANGVLGIGTGVGEAEKAKIEEDIRGEISKEAELKKCLVEARVAYGKCQGAPEACEAILEEQAAVCPSTVKAQASGPEGAPEPGSAPVSGQKKVKK